MFKDYLHIIKISMYIYHQNNLLIVFYLYDNGIQLILEQHGFKL